MDQLVVTRQLMKVAEDARSFSAKRSENFNDSAELQRVMGKLDSDLKESDRTNAAKFDRLNYSYGL